MEVFVTTVNDVFGGAWAEVTKMAFPPSWGSGALAPYLQNEDPYLWMDSRGNFHLLAHRYLVNHQLRGGLGAERERVHVDGLHDVVEERDKVEERRVVHVTGPWRDREPVVGLQPKHAPGLLDALTRR